MSDLGHIKGFKSILVFAFLTLILIITFETSQQLFYLKRFNLDADATFFLLLKNQAYRWLIWFLLAIVLVYFIRREKDDFRLSTSKIRRYTGLIIGLVLFNILIISAIQLLNNGDSFSLSRFLTEYIQFYIYQKGAMYTLGYVAITVILHLYFANERLQIKVQKLSELKATSSELYNELKKQIDDKTTILNIKVGNKRKIIPTNDVLWIEADDYCVRVHTKSTGSYTMRSSLKTLEEKLGTSFLRVHRKALVNMAFAKELRLSETPNLILNNDTHVPVSKRNLKVVKDFLN